MGSELIINATLPETRIALLEKGEIQELHIEREHNRGIVGNIYKGRVTRVLPGMQAAFVDIGHERAAFLYVDDVYFPDMTSPLEVQSANSVQSTETSPATPGGSEEDLDAARADVSTTPATEVPADSDDDIPQRKSQEGVQIQSLLKEGQEILVQVAKEPIGTKGARLTCHISLPGRYLVFMPTLDHVGVSRKIENDTERRRLRENILKYRPPGTGFIVRTASSTQDEDKIQADIDYLVRTWNDVREKFRQSAAPNLAYQDFTLIVRALRDMVTDDLERIVVDSRRDYQETMKFVQKFMPQLKNKVELYEKATPIFDYFGIELELARALERKVWLKSGGYLVIDQSEALVSIDVNTGRYVGKKNLEDTILKTNLEAVKEIAYQLRLRNCGGIIILDLIDMEKESNRERVYQALDEELRKDRSRPTILKISQLGLVEMTRKRTRDSVVRTLCEPCPYCDGRGFIKNKLTVAYDILRSLEREAMNRETDSLVIECNSSVAQFLAGIQSDLVDQFQKDFGKEVLIRDNPHFHLEQFEVVANRGEKRYTIREVKRDARALGRVVSIEDEILERRSRNRWWERDWEKDVSRDRDQEKELEAMDEEKNSLPFIDNEKTAADGERSLRPERPLSGDRGRRYKKSNSSSRDRDKDRDSRDSKDGGKRTRRSEKASRSVAVPPDELLDQDRDESFSLEQEEALDSPSSNKPKNVRQFNPAPMEADQESESEDESDDTGLDSDEGDQDLADDQENETHQEGDREVLPREAFSGPNTYEEYILSAPLPGTELTRAEWENLNYQRRLQAGLVRPHRKQAHRHHRGHRFQKRRNPRRGGGGGGRSMRSQNYGRPRPASSPSSS